jgi:hypothetical protein
MILPGGLAELSADRNAIKSHLANPIAHSRNDPGRYQDRDGNNKKSIKRYCHFILIGTNV